MCITGSTLIVIFNHFFNFFNIFSNKITITACQLVSCGSHVRVYINCVQIIYGINVILTLLKNNFSTVNLFTVSVSRLDM